MENRWWALALGVALGTGWLVMALATHTEQRLTDAGVPPTQVEQVSTAVHDSVGAAIPAISQRSPEAGKAAADWSDGTLAEHEAFFRQSIANPPAEFVRLAAVHDGRLIGYIDLHGSAPRVRELSYVIGPSATWGRGAGSEGCWVQVRIGPSATWGRGAGSEGCWVQVRIGPSATWGRGLGTAVARAGLA